LYPEAVDCTKIVGGYLVDLVAFLGQQGGNIHGMHAMGHSLGAHLVSQLSVHKIARITGKRSCLLIEAKVDQALA